MKKHFLLCVALFVSCWGIAQNVQIQKNGSIKKEEAAFNQDNIIPTNLREQNALVKPENIVTDVDGVNENDKISNVPVKHELINVNKQINLFNKRTIK